MRIRAKRRLLLAIGTTLLMSLPARAWETPEGELEELSTLTLDYVTPHTVLARPPRLGASPVFSRSRS